MPEIENLGEAQKAVSLHASPRFARMDNLERFVDGTQYDGRPDFWASPETPLMERAPAIVDPVADDAIQSYVDLVLSEHRFPELEVSGVDGDKIAKMFRRSRLRAVAKQVLTQGLKCGTAATVFGMRGGRPFVDGIPAKSATPELDPNTGAVLSLEIRYAYVDEYKANGKWHARAMLYRRRIDAKTDTTFLPIPASLTGDIEAMWIADPAATFTHGCGCCPVIWWPAMAEHTIAGSIDGHAIHEHVLDEIFCHDIALSQLTRAAYFAGDPQLYEIGVEIGSSPSPGGRSVTVPGTPNGGVPKPGDKSSQYVVSSGAARKKGPGQVWQYENPETKVGILELSSGALDAISKTADRLRSLLCNAMAYVPLDPEKLPRGIISGKALEALRARQISRCDTLRDDFAEGWLVPAVAMLCMVCKLATVTDEDIGVDWPPYFLPTNEERSTLLTAETDNAAKAMSLIPCPAFAEAIRKRLAKLILEDVSDEEGEEIEKQIEALEPPEANVGTSSADAEGEGSGSGGDPFAPKKRGSDSRGDSGPRATGDSPPVDAAAKPG